MARVAINTGAKANDGTGDTLRAAGGIINDNFLEVYTYLGAGSTTTLSAPVWNTTNAGINILRNVGIGTTNPTSALTVSGVVSATSFYGTLNAGQLTGSLPAIDGSALINVVSSNNGIIIKDDGSAVGTAGTIDFGTNLSVSFASGIATIFFEGRSGTIGIGSTFPALTGNGNLFYHIDYGKIFVYYDEVSLGIGGDAYWVDAAPFNVGIITALSQWVTTAAGIHTLSNVGIGTTNPTSALTVSGNARVTGVVTASSFSGSGSSLTGIVTSLTAGSGISLNPSTGNVTITATGGAGSSQFVTTAAGIHTLSNVGIGTTNPQSPLQVERYGLKTGIGTFIASAGITTDIDAFTISQTDFKVAEYTLHVEYGTHIQAQKVLIMQNQTFAFAQEYGVMYEPAIIVSVGATISAGVCKLQLTPETGISGIITCRFLRGAML
jgi:hypothetical protein